LIGLLTSLLHEEDVDKEATLTALPDLGCLERHYVFSINVPVRFQGKTWTAIGFDNSAGTYQLRGDDGQVVTVSARTLEVAA
jgi:hypothetical protein